MASQQTARFAAIILAAGASRRMGAAKALLQIDGKPLIRHLLDSLIQSRDVSTVVVVTGSESQQIEAAVAGTPVALRHNPDYLAGGMLSSVKYGVAAIADHVDGFIIALLDQPLVLPETIRALTRQWGKAAAPVVLPAYNGKRGHPVLIASRCAPEILSLPANGTLRDFVAQHLPQAQVVDVADPGVISVLDTPQDFEILKAQWRSLTCPTEPG